MISSPIKLIKNLCPVSFKTQDNYRENLIALISLVQKSTKNSIVVAPEVCLSGFDYTNFEESAKFSKIATAEIQENSKDKTIILSMIEKIDDKFYNVLKVIHNKNVVHKRAKARLFHLGGEHKYFTSGDDRDIEIIEVDGVKIASILCFELRFKEIWKICEGADVITVSSFWGKSRKEHLLNLIRSLAIINQCYVVSSDSLSAECTQSIAVINPNGQIFIKENTSSLKIEYNKEKINLMRQYINVGI